jgi:hypothetical protein
MPLKLLVTLLLTAVSSAQVPPRLCPRIVLQGDAVGASFWLLAPDIVIVKVHKAT